MILNDFKVEQWMNDHEKDAVYNLTDTCAVNLTLDQLLELETLDFSEIVMDYGDITGDTELKNFPLFCPKCKQETLIHVTQFNTTVIKEPDAQTQSR